MSTFFFLELQPDLRGCHGVSAGRVPLLVLALTEELLVHGLQQGSSASQSQLGLGQLLRAD